MNRQRRTRFTRREFGTGLMMLGASAIGVRAQAEEPAKPERVPTPKSRPRIDEGKAAAPAKKVEKAWLTLPPTPTLLPPEKSAVIAVNGVDIYYATYGKGPAVVLLHGGLGNSHYWGHQVPELAQHFTVIVVDTRGHGRSPMTSRKFGFNVFAQDVEALLAAIEQPFVSIVGWSDGAITGLQLALTRPNLVSRLFAFGANSTLSGLIPNGSRTPVFASYITRAKAEYERLSPSPKKWPQLVSDLGLMWRTQPNFTSQQLKTIKCPTAVADGAHDEIIKLDHTRDISRQIPGSQLIIQPDVSHFAMLQAPAQFNQTLLKFLLAET
jgi:pimeloyl-ACP methyl ester carboxylesterase